MDFNLNPTCGVENPPKIDILEIYLNLGYSKKCNKKILMRE